MQKERKPNGYWDNYERCYEAAKQCKSHKEFEKKFKGAYCAALRHGWSDDYTWFKPKRKMKNPGYWTEERCYAVALTCKSRGELFKKAGGAYDAARRHGWITNYTWFTEPTNVYINKTDNVYGYFFIEQHAVYIGRTIQPDIRKLQHNSSGTVYEFAVTNNTQIPEMTILVSGLTLAEGLEKEDYYCKKYRDNGWIVLNKAKTGSKSGSLGTIGGGKWGTYNTVYKEAQKYSSRTEFATKCHAAYAIALKNGWLVDFTWFIKHYQPMGYWDVYDNVYNEALKYKTRTEFKKNAGSAFQSALRHKWLDNFTWFINGKVNNSYTSKSVKQLTLHGELVKIYPSLHEITRQTGYSFKNISSCCSGRRKTSYGYRWEYVN